MGFKETKIKTAGMKAEELLRWACDAYGDKITFACSFGAEDVVLLDMLAKLNPRAKVFTLDTGRLNNETYELMDRIRSKYGAWFKVYSPDSKEVERLLNEKGPISFRYSIENRKECCGIRKVKPLKRALSGMSAWITGMRAEQSITRRGLSHLEEDEVNPGLLKINPLWNWSNLQVWAYIRNNDVPYNSLHDQGYPSIGCAPCTRAIKNGEDVRAGRWWWEQPEKRECGLHIKPNNVKIKITPPKTQTIPEVNVDSQYLDQLESQSIYVIREAYRKFRDVALLWSIGKDSTVLLWLIRKAFFGKVPFPCIHCDTTYKFKEIIEYRDKYAKEWNLDLIVGKNEKALADGMGPHKGKFVCCSALKTQALQQVLDKHKFRALFVGIRRDEEGSRGKERYFSPRNKSNKWNYKEQPPELWDQFNTDFDDDVHIRIHPLLHWTEVDIWAYVKREKLPMLSAYFSKNGQRYRSVGCECCCSPCSSNAKSIDEIIDELKGSKVSERAGRAHDKEKAYTLQKLRADGFM